MSTSRALPSESLPALQALPSESLPACPQDYTGGPTRGPGGDPNVILLVKFVDWAKKIVTPDGRTPDRQTDIIFEIVM